MQRGSGPAVGGPSTFEQPVYEVREAEGRIRGAGGLAAVAAQRGMPRVLVTAATLIDGTGAPPVTPGAVLIEGERIAEVGGRIDVPDDVERVDLGNATVLPGLIDMHVHLSDAGAPDPASDDAVPAAGRSSAIADHARRTLAAGFTTVRDVGGRDHLEFAVRDAIAAGRASGPRLVLAGKIVSVPTPGASTWRGMYREAAGTREVEAAVREQAAAGADVIKVMATGSVLAPASEGPEDAQYTLEELRAAVDTAHALGRRVAVHAHGIEGIRRAVAAGADTIEHGTHLHEDPLVAQAMVARGVHLVPTLKAIGNIAAAHRDGIPADMVAKARERIRDRDATFRLALESGVPITMGTDAATPFNLHGENAEEIALMVSLGMAPLAAISAATGAAARALGRSDIGVLAAGRLADLAVWDGDPVADITLLQRAPRAVLLGGRRVV